jgi:hypothetical protein
MRGSEDEVNYGTNQPRRPTARAEYVNRSGLKKQREEKKKDAVTELSRGAQRSDGRGDGRDVKDSCAPGTQVCHFLLASYQGCAGTYRYLAGMLDPGCERWN